MYTPWLHSTSRPSGDFSAFSIGRRLLERRPRKIEVALIGIDAAVAEKTRQALYHMAWDFGKLRLADLGDLRKPTPEFSIPLLRELHTAKIIPLLIGGDPSQFISQYLAFGELNRQVSILQVDAKIRLSSPGTEAAALLDRAIYRSSLPAFHLSHVGSQQHLVNPDINKTFEERHFERYRLGVAKSDLTQLEPSIRDADLMGIDLAAVQWAEAPAQTGYLPSGFSLQEACQLCYYAGNSDRLSSFGIYGFDDSERGAAETRLTATAYAQLSWYFLHGMSRRSGDFPVTTEGLLEYVVDTKMADRLTFWRSPRTNRWWVQVPAKNYRGEERNRLVSCSYQDYLQASNEGDLPDRLVNAFSRF